MVGLLLHRSSPQHLGPVFAVSDVVVVVVVVSVAEGERRWPRLTPGPGAGSRSGESPGGEGWRRQASGPLSSTSVRCERQTGCMCKKILVMFCFVFVLQVCVFVCVCVCVCVSVCVCVRTYVYVYVYLYV